MKKMLSFNIAMVLLLLCGCTGTQENKDTQFLFDTVATLTADCDDKVLNGAFALCRDFENLLSRTVEGSDVYRLNNAEGAVEISEHTASIIDRSLYYSDLCGGKFDITVYSLSTLWDFKEEIIPSKDEIAEALKSVDYQRIQLSGNTADLGGAKIDLGGIAKGYIADRLREYFAENGANEGIIDLGGNIVVFGNRDYNIGIKKPFSGSELAATVSLKNASIVTSGIYERYIERDGRIYHHILDTATGYSADTDLHSATVISPLSVDGDALATVCMLLGKEEATKLIESIPETEAVFIENTGNISHTSGLDYSGGVFTYK